MKIKTITAAAALAIASTAAVADVTTSNGDLVVVEKNQSAQGSIGSLEALGGAGPVLFGILIVAVAAAGGS